MIEPSDLPVTEQGLKDFINYSLAEIKRCDNKIKRLNKLKDQCEYQLNLIGKGSHLCLTPVN